MNRNLLILTILLLTFFSFSCVHFEGGSPKCVKDLYKREDNCLYIEENGKYVPFLVIDQDYGGNVLLLRKEPLESPMSFNSYRSLYENSDIDQYLNSEYISLLTDQNLSIPETDVITAADHSIGSAGQETSVIKRKVFLLSYTELGFDDSVNAAHEGEPLKYFQKTERRIAAVQDNPVSWWLRSPDTYFASCVYYIGINNTVEIGNAYDENWIRPAFCVSGDASIEERKDIFSDRTVYTLSE